MRASTMAGLSSLVLLLSPGVEAQAEKATKVESASSLTDKPAKTRFYFRVGGLHLAPIMRSDNVVLSNVSPFAELAVQEGPIENSGAGIDSLTVPAAIIGYVLPYLDGRLSIEAVLGLPLTLDLKVTGAMATESLAPFALGNVPTGVPALGESLGTAKAVPPLITAVYRFLPDKPYHPYVGGGLMMMFVYDAEIDNPVLTSASQPTLDVSNGYGVVAQAGIEARLYDRYYATLDLKTVLGLSVEAVVQDIYVQTPELPLFETAKVGDASVEIGIVPIIITAGVGADF